jgi:hypothetical protein
MTLHAKLSASGSHRWLNCSGSVQAESEYPESNTSFAQEGTAAHELADKCLRSGDNSDQYLGVVIEGVTVDADMVEHVQGYLDFVRSFDGELFPEQRVDFSPWVHDGFGTSDAIVITSNKVHIIDLKYGQGVIVDAENNTQGMLYALGVYNDYGYLLDDQDSFVIHIYQPRANNFSEWEISLKDLLKWGEWVKLRADEALEKDAPRTPGDKQCMFCKAKASCPALLKFTQEIIIAEFDDLDDLQDPNKLSNAQIKKVLEGKKLIESWLSAVESSVFAKLMNGEKFKGFKLVEGRSLRQWANESAAQVALLSLRDENEVFTKKLISPAQAEKLLGKKEAKQIQDLIIKPQGKPTLTTEDDKRPEFGNVENLFDEVVDS